MMRPRACATVTTTKNSLLLINRTASYDGSSAFGLSQAEAEYSGGIPQASKFGPFGDLLDGNVTLVATRTLMRKGRASRATKLRIEAAAAGTDINYREIAR